MQARDPLAEPRPSTRGERWALAAIVVFAVAIRLIRLGTLSDAGDEETTTLGALALLRGFPPVLPGGTIYIRELPFTFVEAAIVFFSGLNEFALRLVPTLVAGPRVAAMWFLARPFLGGRLSLLAAGLLAVAPLDFELSRITRMYSPFATLDLVLVVALVYIALGRRHTALAVGAGLLSMLTHVLTVTHAPVAWCAAFGRDVPRRTKATLVGIGTFLVLLFAVWNRLVEGGYAAAGPPLGPDGLHSNVIVSRVAASLEILGTPARAVFLLLAILATAAVAIFGLRKLETTAGRIAGAAAVLASLAGAPFLGGILLLSIPICEGTGVVEAWRRTRWILLPAMVAGASIWFLMAASASSGGGIGPAVRFLLGFPYPNWFDLIQAAPLLSLLSLAGAVLAVDRIAKGPIQGAWIALIVAALAPPLVTGLIAREDALRYEIHALAPMIVLGVLAASTLFARARSRAGGAVLAGFLMLVAVRPDQTVRAMFRGYGPVDEPFAVLNVAPDHKGASEFVLAHRSPQDWIVAEDMLEQYLYIGRTDVWLRRREDANQFLQNGAEDRIPRDVYTGAMHAHDLDALWDLARSRGVRALWLITSAEVEASPQYYRTLATDSTLREWRPLAWFVGEDRMTRVYWVVDGKPVPPPGAGGTPPRPGPGDGAVR